MESVLHEFTPPEFGEALSEIEHLCSVLEWIVENGPDDAWDLRSKARQALVGIFPPVEGAAPWSDSASHWS